MPLLPSSIGAATEAVVAMLRINGLIVTVLLAFLGAAWWVLTTYRRAGAGGSSLRRAALAAFTLAICVTGLHLVDESTARKLGPPPAAVTDRSMRAVFAEWVRELPPASANDNRIYLVASEGGGIRSAYWKRRCLPGYTTRTARSIGEWPCSAESPEVPSARRSTGPVSGSCRGARSATASGPGSHVSTRCRLSSAASSSRTPLRDCCRSSLGALLPACLRAAT